MTKESDVSDFQNSEPQETAAEEFENGSPSSGEELCQAHNAGQRRFASDVPFNDPGRDLHWADSGTYGIESRFWKRAKGRYSDAHERYFSKHEARREKDGKAIFPGELTDKRCLAANVRQIDFIIADIDATSVEEIGECIANIESARLGCDIYSTHNHGVPQTEIKYDDFHDFCRQKSLSPESSEAAQLYLTQVKKYPNSVADTAAVKDGCAQSCEGQGTVVVIGHHPMIKLRVVFTLDEPYVPVEQVRRGFSDKDARKRVWGAALRTLFNALGIPFDESAIDVARRFYAASCPPETKVVFLTRIEGNAVRLASILPKSVEGLDAIVPKAAGAEGKKRHPKHAAEAPQDLSFQGVNLVAWIAQYGLTFQIETALYSHEQNSARLRAQRANGGVHIECPFEAEHTKAGGEGTFVVNATENGNKGIGVHCCHNSCLTSRGNGQSVDRVLFIKEMLERGWLTLEDLQNPELGGGAVSPRVFRQTRRWERRPDLRVVDRDGTGIDVGVFHAKFVAKSGQLDFARLNEVCGTQIDSDVSAEQLAEFIEEGWMTVNNLIDCAASKSGSSADNGAYRIRLRELAGRKQKGGILAKDVAIELESLKAEFGVNKKDAEADLKQIETEATSAAPGFGVLSAEEAALIEPMRDYVRDFAIINTGGKGVVMNLTQPDISKAIMPPDGFELLYRKDWIEVEIDGGLETIYPAKRFLAKPPKDAQVYLNGLVFKPRGTVGAGEFNLYQGLLIGPDASGSCSLFHELIRDVWAQGDEDTAAWVLEYFMHVIAHPGEKVGTSIAIRGEPGDGKSIVCEKLMSTIFGDMLLRVANHRIITGDFNEALIGKLLTVLEEAAFAGDKQAFDRMKELITGDKVLINPKFKAPISVDNYSRMIVISNHDHFLHIKPGDRRYTALESSPIWRGTTKFEQLLDQWPNGGAGRFVYEALNHSFRRFDDRKQLIINTSLKTTAGVRQMAQSRSALEKCIVAFLLRGDFKAPKTGQPVLMTEDGGGDVAPIWPLDKELSIQSLTLEAAVSLWLRDHDPVAAKHETTLHTIIGTLEKYVGDTLPERAKGAKDSVTGKRPQLPTARTLPKREEAIEHARENGLITAEEYESAVPQQTGGVR